MSSEQHIASNEQEKNVNVSELLDLYSNVNVLFCVAETTGYFSLLNPYWTEVLGWSLEELKARPFLDFVHPDDRPATNVQADAQFIENEPVSSFINRYRTKDGNYRWLEWTARSPQGGMIYAVAHDITEKKEKEFQLQQVQDRLEELVQNVPGAFFQYIVNGDGKHVVEYMSPGSKDIWDLTPEEIINDPGSIWRLIHPDDIEPLQNSIQSSVETLSRWEQEYRIKLPGGEIRWLRGVGNPRRLESGATFWNSLVTDVTELKEQQNTIAKMAYHDHLTGLPNRFLLADRIEQQILMSRRTNKSFGLLFLDLDNFKSINDSLGHSIGDKLLTAATEVLQHTLRDVDTIARISGDEFVIVLNQLDASRQAEAVAKKILDKFNAPIKIESYELNISWSIGISMYPTDGTDGESLLKTADTAMYNAKKQGKNNFQFYSSELAAASQERFFIENELKRAVLENEFELFYQPQTSAYNPDEIQVEALIRWNHPEIGQIAPNRFIPIAEETRIIVQIGDWVINEAIAQMKDWVARGVGIERVAINISYIQLHYGDLLTTLDNAITRSELPESKVELEITESAILRDTSKSQIILNSCKEKGYRLSIDDFGVGYSSLSQLKSLPFDKIKIDKSFVDDITSDQDSDAVAISIINLAHSLGLSVIAEGVESHEQKEFLLKHGCHKFQGYLYSRPLPAREIEDWYSSYVTRVC